MVVVEEISMNSKSPHRKHTSFDHGKVRERCSSFTFKIGNRASIRKKVDNILRPLSFERENSEDVAEKSKIQLTNRDSVASVQLT